MSFIKISEIQTRILCNARKVGELLEMLRSRPARSARAQQRKSPANRQEEDNYDFYVLVTTTMLATLRIFPDALAAVEEAIAPLLASEPCAT